ncbi:Modification methylase MjaII [uncultured archaeon]|nr:Modification methylase MjaII [uncultured archaeon]
MRNLLLESLAKKSEYEKLLTPRFDLESQVTFQENKQIPLHRWFYYKEGYSPNLVTTLLKEYPPTANLPVLDPFCGTGTTLLASRDAGFPSVGTDILPLGVFVANTKLQTGYDTTKLADECRKLLSVKFGTPTQKFPRIDFLDTHRAVGRYAREDLMFFRERILAVEDEKIRNFMMLALISIALQSSNLKRDGGVLKIKEKQHLPPVRHLLKQKLKHMQRDIEHIKEGPESRAEVADARALPAEDNSFGACITSPPYLNYVDYTKLYALELALLVGDGGELKSYRKKSLKSHVNAEAHEKNMPPLPLVTEVIEKSRNIPETKTHNPQVIEGYFTDMYRVLKEISRTLAPGAPASLVVGNACLPNQTVDVDTILAELAKNAGLKPEALLVANARWCDVHGITKERPVRETIVVVRKPE